MENRAYNAGQNASTLRAVGLWSFLLVFSAALVLGLDRYTFNFTEILPCVVIVYAASRIAALQLIGAPRLITLCHWLFAYIFLGIAPLLQLLHGGTFPWGARSYNDDSICLGFIAIFIGLIAFDLGCWSIRKTNAKNIFEVASGLASRGLAQRRILILATLSIVISAVSVVALGGLTTLFASRVDQPHQIQASSADANLALVGAVLRVPSAAAFLLLLTLMSLRRKHPFGISGRFLLFITVPLVLLISNPLSSPRFWTGTILLGTAFILFRWNNGRSVAITAVGVTVIFALVFPMADAYRTTLAVRWSDKFSEVSPSRTVATKPDFDAVQQVLNTVQYVDANGFTYGKQMLGTCLFWVPRSAWPNKPVSTAILVSQGQGFAFTNVSLPLWGELYIDGGLPLVFLGFLAYGAFITWMEQQYMRDRVTGRATFALVFVPVFAPYEFFLLRGSLMVAVAYLFPLVALLWMGTSPYHRRQRQYAPHVALAPSLNYSTQVINRIQPHGR